MGSFLHDLHNGPANTSTEALRDMVIASGAQNDLLAFTIVHGNRAMMPLAFVRSGKMDSPASA